MTVAVKGMRVSIFFAEFIHYHVARCSALRELLSSLGGGVYIYSLREKAPDRPLRGEHRLLGESIRVLNQNQVPENSWASVRSLLSALSHDEPDAVAIPGYWSWPCLAALAWCKLKSRLAVLMSESQRRDLPRRGLKEWLKGRLMRCFDAALVGGRPQRQYARELGLAPEVIFTGYDVVDNRFWQQEAAAARGKASALRARLGLPPKFFVSATRFIPRKNLVGLIQAYAHYHSWAPDQAWHLVVCGSGSQEGEIRDLMGRLGLAAWVHLPGYQEAGAMAVYYGLASALIHASSHNEPWGLVVNEAMAAGLPVLVSQVCGCVPDLVQEGVNGFTFDPDDAPALARLMLKVSSGEVDLQAMGRASREIIAHWTPQTFAQNLVSALAAAKEAKRARRAS
jgi:1,2-diacylglycerol 3-alpha-glucosyltransferase